MMNKREDALRDALQKNEGETQRWQMFLKEQETVIKNLTTFGKQLTVDVMVPIGKKALMPGYLLHTNEVLVGHYQGYFSKCTTFKAKEICEFRMKMAKDHLKKLELEAELWQNKLEKPYTEGIVPSGEEKEIIEEFDEEAENLWKQEHRIRLKQAKQKEREEREKDAQKLQNSGAKTEDDIFKMLEDAEIMEELEQELDTLEIDDFNDEMLRKLMSGEMKLTKEKKRLAHGKNEHKGSPINKEKFLSPNIVKIKDLDGSGIHLRTNNNVQPNQEIIDLADEQTESDEVEVEEEETLPEEVALIKQQAKYLGAEDQIGFYDYQIQIIKQKLQLLPLRTPQELNEKIHLLSVLEYLEELLEEAEEYLGETELAAKDNDEPEEKFEESNENGNECSVENKVSEKRRISFALEDQTLEFRKHEAVTQMLPSKVEKPERDIIKLDDFEERKKEYSSHKVSKFANKQAQIKDKVEKNLKFVAENQSIQDFNLVEKILQSSQCEIKTLYIKFKHSQKESYICKEIPGIIGSPADIYINGQQSTESGSSTFFVHGYEGEDLVNTPVLKEADRQSAYSDPKSEFSNPLQAKSILKNKSAVDKENLYESNTERNVGNKHPKKTPNKKDDDLLSTYNKVMNEVVEKPLTEPEPLPAVKFVDAHAPKKRISRFKQMRQENEIVKHHNGTIQGPKWAGPMTGGLRNITCFRKPLTSSACLNGEPISKNQFKLKYTFYFVSKFRK